MLSSKHAHTQGTMRCIKVNPVCAESSWKEEGSSSWQAYCCRSIRDCFYRCLWTPPLHCVILSFAELCSFVVHLLCCVGSINLISSLFSPITNSQLSFARSSTACLPFLRSLSLSSIIQQAHL